MNFLTDGDSTHDVAEDVVCGRTTATRSGRGKRHEVIWACGGCGAHEASGRQIALRELVHTRERVVPTWTIRAELGQ
jgi:ribosomal protein L37AE/L43A